MNVFMLGTDKTLLGASGVGDAPERHRRYGEHIEHLDIVVATRRNESFQTTDLSENVRAYPSRSLIKPLFFFDAIRIFKYVFKRHPVDLVVAQDPFLLGLAGWWLKRRYGVKLAVSFHGDFWENPHWLGERFINRLFLYISYFTAPRADAIRAVSEAIRKKLVRRVGTRRRIAVIPTPVVLERFRLPSDALIEEIRSRYGARQIILFVGRLTSVKNIPFLLRAFLEVKKSYAKAVLLIVGDGPEQGRIESLRDALGLNEDVFLLGRAEHDRALQYYGAADLVVLPSFSEGLPKVLVEAAARGKPLVGTNVGGIPEIIEDNGNGFLVPLGDSSHFAQKMIMLLNDEPLRRRMGARSEQIARERFGDTTEKLIEFWKEVVNSA
jgi:glycosyltransferase involved in cell wall biosynthesis